MTALVSLTDAEEHHGGKAAALGALLRAGFPVPAGVVIPCPILDGWCHGLCDALDDVGPGGVVIVKNPEKAPAVRGPHLQVATGVGQRTVPGRVSQETSTVQLFPHLTCAARVEDLLGHGRPSGSLTEPTDQGHEGGVLLEPVAHGVSVGPFWITPSPKSHAELSSPDQTTSSWQALTHLGHTDLLSVFGCTAETLSHRAWEPKTGSGGPRWPWGAGAGLPGGIAPSGVVLAAHRRSRHSPPNGELGSLRVRPAGHRAPPMLSAGGGRRGRSVRSASSSCRRA